MRMGTTTLIPCNIAPHGARGIVILDETGREVGHCGLGSLALPELGVRLYRAGWLSDSHTTLSTANAQDSQDDLARAIRYFSKIGAELVCVCGDLCHYNDDGGLEKHLEIVSAHKGSMKILEIAGNHEHFNKQGVEARMDSDTFQALTGRPLCYVEEHKGDVYVMCGACSWGSVFDSTSFSWLESTLAAYAGRRVFLFVHSYLEGTSYCGDAKNVAASGMIENSYKSGFEALLRAHPNVFYVHGHSHVMLQMQNYLQSLTPPLPANYDNALGCHSVQLPSLAYPRDLSNGDKESKYGESQGYLVDVYANHVVLTGLDFANGADGKPAVIPVACYCLETV